MRYSVVAVVVCNSSRSPTLTSFQSTEEAVTMTRQADVSGFARQWCVVNVADASIQRPFVPCP
jgi:hypothetical protein